MPLTDILALLEAEKQRIQNAIDALTGGTTKPRRGRPRKDASLSNAPDWVLPKKKERKKRKFTAKQRQEQSRRAKAMWKKRKAEEKG
jgi:hypothetical protein